GAGKALSVPNRQLLRRPHRFVIIGGRSTTRRTRSARRRIASQLRDHTVFLCGDLYYWISDLYQAHMSHTSANSAGPVSEKEARDVAEAARETEWENPSFVRELFLGRFRLDLIHPHPPADAAEEARARPFMDKLRAFMERVDSEEIDRTGEIPESTVQELRDMGAFGIKIPKEYGGLGLSQMSYIRAIEMVTSKDGSLTALLSAHQSIGVPQPLKLFGTEEQKKKYFPRLAKGAISAFALTEVDAGSDPANMRTTATPTEDGQHFIINGEKLWCTNGTRAELFVVMARTPDKDVKGKHLKQITAFIVDSSMPGVEVKHRLRFKIGRAHV